MTDEQSMSTQVDDLSTQEVQAPSVSSAESNTTTNVYEAPKEQQQASQAVEQTQARHERTFTRDELARATAAAKQSAYEQAKAELIRQYQSPQDNQGVAPDEFGAKVEQVLQKKYLEGQMQLEANRLADSFEEAAKKYQDWDDVTRDMSDVVNHYTAPLFNKFDNAADIIYELGKNPEKIPQFAAVLSNPDRAFKVLKKISDGIKSNQDAVKQPVPNAPLSQERPSTAGVDSGSMTVTDLRSQDWLRG
jgi:hypothetical protein